MREDKRVAILNDASRLRYLMLGTAGIVRYGERRENFGALNQSVAEHVMSMTILRDYFREQSDVSGLDLDWERVDKMIRYHDVGEIENGDVPCVIKTQEHEADEADEVQRILHKMPGVISAIIGELVKEYETGETIEAKFVMALDKIEAQLFMMSEDGIQEGVGLIRRLGKNNAEFATGHKNKIIAVLEDLGIQSLIEFYEVVWQQQVEFGLLEEDPQMVFDLRIETK